MLIELPDCCENCSYCNLLPTNANTTYCRMKAINPDHPELDVSTAFVDPKSRPDWCPIIELNKTYDSLPKDKQEAMVNIMKGFKTLWS